MHTMTNELKVISITGDKASTFLQGQVTCDMNQLLQTGDSSLAACCDHKGRMLANFWIARTENAYLLILPEAMRDDVISHLNKYAMFSKVTVSANDTYHLFSTNNIAISALKKTLTPQALTITLPNAKRHLVVSEDTSLASSTDHDWTEQNITDGLCLITPETSLLFTPQMINLEQQGGVSFEKGCYVGQEIIARTQHLGKLKRHLHRITLKMTACPASGDALLNKEGIKVGIITTALHSAPNSVKALAVIEDRQLGSIQEMVLT